MRIHLVLLALAALVACAHGYCWQVGYNPGFTGPPKVEQVAINEVRISWEGIVTHRDCADQFLVKYWPRTSPNAYETSELVPPDVSYMQVKVTPKVTYQFQAVAREDKGLVGGIDWNKSPIVDFKTSRVNEEVPKLVQPIVTISPKIKDVGAYSNGSPNELSVQAIKEAGQDPPPGHDSIKIAGMPLFGFVGMVIASLLCLVILIGVLYQCATAKRKNKALDDVEEDEDDVEDDGAHETNRGDSLDLEKQEKEALKSNPK